MDTTARSASADPATQEFTSRAAAAWIRAADAGVIDADELIYLLDHLDTALGRRTEDPPLGAVITNLSK